MVVETSVVCYFYIQQGAMISPMSVCVFVGLSVGLNKNDFISLKFGWQMDFGLEKTRFGVNLD